MTLLTEDGRLVEALVSLAQKHGINVPRDMSARDLSEAMQEKWLRRTAHQFQVLGDPPGQEDLFLLRQLDMIEQVNAPLGLHKGALVLGGTPVAVRRRLAHLAGQVRAGTRVERVFLLGGARRLDPEREGVGVLTTPAEELPFRQDWSLSEVPETEAEMMRVVFDQSNLPERLRDISVLVNAPLHRNGDSPSTADTVAAFLDLDDLSRGQYLVVTGQPHVARQTINVRDCMPDGFTVVGSGYGATLTLPLRVFLDEVARLLFEQL